MNSTRKLVKYIAALLLLALCPAAPGQEKTSRDNENSTASRFPSHGVRFVICSPTGERVPTPLYAKVNKDYLPIRISSRMPTPRLAPIEGKISLYTKAPSAKTEKTDTPYLTLTVPKDYRSKSLCVVMPNKEGKVEKSFFMKESEFVKGGIYIINLSHVPLEMTTSDTGEFGDEKKTKKIEAGSGIKHVSKEDENVWSYVSKADRKRISFILNAKPMGIPPVRIKAGAILTNKNATQVNFVVDHPTLKNSYKLLSVQYSDVDLEQTAAPGEIPTQP